MSTAGLACVACGTDLPANSKFCNECGAPVSASTKAAEYKQVTVLFADVVHSMDLAAAVGAERLREIMAGLLDRATAVVTRYGGTVNQFTGDGVMAVFGAPTALEDHAFRACLASLGLHDEMRSLSQDVAGRDGVALQLRIGLNSGQVIAGEIGSNAASYTTIGEQVGLAQRMESVAPPGGVMLSESTARLVEANAELAEPEFVLIKGASNPVAARRLLAIGEHQPRRRSEPTFVGRSWELNTITSILDEAARGAGCVIDIVGLPGIGKSRLVRESAAIAVARGVPVFGTYCESHARDVPFHAVARMLRAGMGVDDADAHTARARVCEQFPTADPADLVLLYDLLGIRDPEVPLPDVAADARRRRLTAMINSASLERGEPAMYVIEDAQWIDEASESMLADFLAVVPQSRAVTLVTHRPEYRGVLTRISGAQTIALRPLSDADVSALSTEILGTDTTVEALTNTIAERAAGNPFFAQEMVRDLSERGTLHGEPGNYELRGDLADVDVPATLQAAIGARIDRLGPTAKRTLNAAAVIGAQFDDELLKAVSDTADVAPLIEAELVDQVRFFPHPEFAFRHPMIRSVAYESQLKADRGQLHRRLAETIERRDPHLADENAALIAQHYESAGDLHAAFGWHMRAGSWSNLRDNMAASQSWRRAQAVADRLPEDDPVRSSMRIAARSFLYATAYRSGAGDVGAGFDELRELCIAEGDSRSLAMGMMGLIMEEFFRGHRREAGRASTELAELLETIGDPTLTVALIATAITAKHEAGGVIEALGLAERAIDLAGGDATKGKLTMGSPLALAIALRGTFARASGSRAGRTICARPRIWVVAGTSCSHARLRSITRTPLR